MDNTMAFSDYGFLHKRTDWDGPSSEEKRQLNNCFAQFVRLVGLGKRYTLPEEKEAYLNTDRDYGGAVSSLSTNLLRTITWKGSVLKKLLEIYEECSEADWDGYGGNPISVEAYFEARTLLKIIPFSFPMPDISPQPNGEVGLEWYRDRGFIFVISVGGKRKITYAGLFGENNETHGMESFGDSLPRAMSENIKRLFPSLGS